MRYIRTGDVTAVLSHFYIYVNDYVRTASRTTDETVKHADRTCMNVPYTAGLYVYENPVAFEDLQSLLFSADTLQDSLQSTIAAQFSSRVITLLKPRKYHCSTVFYERTLLAVSKCQLRSKSEHHASRYLGGAVHRA